MGHLSSGPIAAALATLKDKYHVTTLVETGTYQGVSTEFAASMFDAVVTLDIRDDFQKEGRERCKDLRNIVYHSGDSRNLMPKIVKTLHAPTVFWLDAHSVKDQFGPQDDCPLMEELAAINESPWMHFILIDDAHCYMPPLPPHLNPDYWPTVDDIERKAFAKGYGMWIAHDIIALAPPWSAPLWTSFARFQSKNESVRVASGLARLRCRATASSIPAASGSRHYPPSFAEVVETICGRMIVHKFDQNQTRALKESGIPCGQGDIDVLLEYIKKAPPDPVFVDIGANFGSFAFSMQPHCKAVHAFEAQRRIFNMLAGSIALNGWENVFCHFCALSNGYGKIEAPQFDNWQNLNFGSIEFGITQNEHIAQERQYDPEKREFVESLPLDHFNLKRIDVMKIDVEGMELKVLWGARHTISRCKPIMYIEHNKCGKSELEAVLISLRYRYENKGTDMLCFPMEEANGR